MLISYCCIMRFAPDWPLMGHSMFYVMVALTRGWVRRKGYDIDISVCSDMWILLNEKLE